MTLESSAETFRINRLPPYLLGTLASRVLEARAAGRDVIDLSQVNPNTAPPQAAVDRLVQHVLLPHNHRYSSSQGVTKLRASAAELYSREFGVSLDKDGEVVVTMGIKEGLAHLLLAVLSAGDTVLVPTPAYPLHAASVFIAHAGFIGVPLASDGDGEYPRELTAESNDWFHRLEQAYETAWPRPKLMLLSFPHNPTTITVDRTFFERIVEFAKARNVRMVHDFAYADLVFDGFRAPSLLEVPGGREVGVEFFSLSKSYGLAGWRIGFCVGNEQLVQALKKIKSYVDFGIFQPLQIAAIEALRSGASRVAEVAEEYQARRDVFIDGLRRLGWEIEAPRATVFVWARIPERYEMTSMEFSERLLDEGGVAVCPGVGFDHHADRYVRIALVEREARLRKAIEAIAALAPGRTK